MWSGILPLNIIYSPDTPSLNTNLVPFLTWLDRSDQSSSVPIDAPFVCAAGAGTGA